MTETAFSQLARGDNSGLAALMTPDMAPDADLPTLIAQQADALIDAVHDHGAVLFRGFDGLNANNLEEAVRAATPDMHSYVGGGSPRTRIAGNVYNSTEYPAEAHLNLHIEASYLSEPPQFAWFYCDIEPTSDGETPLGDMRVVLQTLDGELVRKFREKGIRYVNNLHGGDGFGKSWQATYQTDDRSVVEAHLEAQGLDHIWDGNSLRVAFAGPAVRQHRVTGAEYWFNQVATWHPSHLPPRIRQGLEKIYGDASNFPKSALFGDGSAIPDDDARQVIDTLLEAEVTFRWKQGDLLLVDNQAIAHGRRPVTSDRRILVVLS